MQHLKNVSLLAIALVDDPAVPKAYFRVIKREKTIDGLVDQSLIPQSNEFLNTKVILDRFEQLEKQFTEDIKQITLTLNLIKERLNNESINSELEPNVEALEILSSTYDNLNLSHQRGEISNEIYSQLLVDIQRELSQFV